MSTLYHRSTLQAPSEPVVAHILHASIVQIYPNVFTQTNYGRAGNRFHSGPEVCKRKTLFCRNTSPARCIRRTYTEFGNIILMGTSCLCCLCVRPYVLRQPFQRIYYTISNFTMVNGRHVESSVNECASPDVLLLSAMTGAHCIKSISCGPFVKNERILRLIYSFGIPLEAGPFNGLRCGECWWNVKCVGKPLVFGCEFTRTIGPKRNSSLSPAGNCCVCCHHRTKSQHAKPQNYEQWIFVRVISINSWLWRVGAASSCSKIVSISMRAAGGMKTKQNFWLSGLVTNGVVRKSN